MWLTTRLHSDSTTMIAILRIAYADRIEATRAEIIKDDANREILGRTADWFGAGVLQKAVMKETKESQSTVKRRIANLLERGVLERRRAGSTVEYRTTGLI